MNTKTIEVLAVALLLSSCKPDEPHWVNACVRSHYETIQMPTLIDSQPYMMPQMRMVCDARQTTCVVPKDYNGKPECSPISQEEIVNEK